MSRASALESFRTWIVSVLTAALGARSDQTFPYAIYADQRTADAPRPPLPYITLDPSADVQLGAIPFRRTTLVSPGVYRTRQYQRRRATVKLTYYGDSAVDGLNLLTDSLTAGVSTTAPISVLHTAGVTAWPAGEVNDTSEIRSTSWEPAASQDWHCFYTRTADTSVGVIETVSAPVNEPAGD